MPQYLDTIPIERNTGVRGDIAGNLTSSVEFEHKKTTSI